MKKILLLLVVVVIACACIAYLARNPLAKVAVAYAVKGATGLSVNIGRMDISAVDTRVEAGQIQLMNPPGYVDPVMVDMPALAVDFNLTSFIRGKIHLEHVRMDLEQLTVVKNDKGQININALTAVQEANAGKTAGATEEKSAQARQIHIDLAEIRIGRVVYKDYSKGSSPETKVFEVGIDEQFRNVTDAKSLVNTILVKALTKTTIERLAGLSLQSVRTSAQAVLEGGAERIRKELGDTAGQAGQGAVDRGVETIKKLLPGREEK